jgi:diadenosine tetraphosphatase ApaH/serine/threonine PP2A family protein phosphatase
MARIGGLGKGMAALLQGTETADESKNYFICPIEKISPNRNQPRKHFAAEKLDELAASIREKGIIQPLVVTRTADGYEIIAGERRWNFLGHLKVRVNDNNYLCVHGSPRRPINEYLFPDDAINNPHKLESIFGRFDRMCLVGHTHHPGVFTEDQEFWKPDELPDRTFSVDPVQKAIINPGSVGQPRDGDPRASYAILDTDAGEDKHRIEFHRLPYDIDITVAKIHAIPELHDWLGDRLLEGR